MSAARRRHVLLASLVALAVATATVMRVVSVANLATLLGGQRMVHVLSVP